MIFPDYFIFVEKTETGFSKPETFYDYKPNKIVIVTGSNFNGKDDVVNRLYGMITVVPKYANSRDYNVDVIKSIFPYFKHDLFTLEKLHNILQLINILDKNMWQDDRIFIDYPENNLYPSEQSALINLICEKAEKRNGIILIPTNSDYIINGILRNVKNGVIKNTDVDILHIGSPEELGICVEEENKSTIVIGKCYIKENGRIKAFDGFFDQYNKDMISLL